MLDKMKTPQQIKNEVEKGCGKYIEEEDRDCGHDYDYYEDEKRDYVIKKTGFDKWLCLSCQAKLSILTEYDKSIKEMIKQAFLNWLEDTTDSPFKIEKELLSKIGDNSEHN